jgi:hypothetical protein
MAYLKPNGITNKEQPMDDKDYIKHEVRLQVHAEKLKEIEGLIARIDGKINWLIGMILGSVMLPVALHLFKLT